MTVAIPKPQPRTAAQNRAMHAVATEVANLSLALPASHIPDAVTAQSGTPAEQWLKAAVKEVSGQERSSLLTSDQAANVIRLLNMALAAGKKALKADSAPPVQQQERRVDALITPAQQAYLGRLINTLANLDGRYKGMTSNPGRLRQWHNHYLGQPWPQSQVDADAAIEALKSILTRTLPPRSTLEACLEDLVQHEDELNLWGRKFIADRSRRSKWGPYQWAKVYQLYLQLEVRRYGETNTAREA